MEDYLIEYGERLLFVMRNVNAVLLKSNHKAMVHKATLEPYCSPWEPYWSPWEPYWNPWEPY